MYIQKERFSPTNSELIDFFDIHHRKPKEQGGLDIPRNRSRVLRSKHNAWHALYEVLPAPAIILQFENDCEVYGTWNPRSNLIQRLVEGYANSTKALIKRHVAWYTLFEGKSLQDIVTEINTVWIDPDYEIQVGTERILKTWLIHTPPRKSSRNSTKKLAR